MPNTEWQQKEHCAECGARSVVYECDFCKKKLCPECVNVQIFSLEMAAQYECDKCLVEREHFEDAKDVAHE